MITVTLHCGQCASAKEVMFDGDKIPDTSKALVVAAAKKKPSGGHADMDSHPFGFPAQKWVWFVQQNGPNLDAYCSKKCSE